ncbi:hypothetical protein MPL3365_170139 [Mesorhizobium plurifarium]|uniref:Uncharacterized protein n=1 Tax=Mesorhizobium plurifarium TaxID=69974 RepID=A0A090FZ76_MESPL|nr:hypothetical protein MPL3365_170139 [Mesorhizobium plurifarium]
MVAVNSDALAGDTRTRRTPYFDGLIVSEFDAYIFQYLHRKIMEALEFIWAQQIHIRETAFQRWHIGYRSLGAQFLSSVTAT